MGFSSGGGGGGVEVGSSTPTTQAHADSAVVGSSEEAARVDHKHAMPSEGGAPAGVIGYFTGSCPSGWSEYTNARGRYVVGTVSGGTGEATVGTVLTDAEARTVGQHNHNVTQYGGNHSMGHNISGIPGRGSNYIPGTQDTNNSGNVAGTNVPYVQLTACKKD